MRIRLSMVLGFFILSSLFMTAARAGGFKEGKWAMTMVMKMDNMSPQMAAEMQQMQNLPPQVQAMMKAKGIQMGGNGQGMTMSITQCLTNNNPIPKQNKAQTDDHCQSTHEMDGNTVKFHSTCNYNNTQMESSGEMTYTGDSMTGHLKNHEVTGGNPTDSSIDISGQYQGPC